MSPVRPGPMQPGPMQPGPVQPGPMRRALPAAAGALLLVACTAVGVGVAADRAAPESSRVAVLGAFRWQEGWEGFGGWSAIDLSADGARAVILGDRTPLVRARLRRDAAGAVTAVEPDPPVLLQDGSGAPLREPYGDSEGLAVAADGAVFVSFEDATRVRREGIGGRRPTELPGDRAFDALPGNGGLEALAVDAGGALYTLPETASDGAFPVLRLAPGARRWEVAFRLPARDGFVPTGADIGPDGRLVVLERQFRGLGFRSRLRRVGLDGAGEEVLWTTGTGDFDNLEGVAVWRDDAGAHGGGLRATLVSDDNLHPMLQQTQLVDLLLPD